MPKTLPKTLPKTRRVSVDADTFIRVYQKGPTLEAVCETLGMERNAVQNRANTYRRKDIALRVYPPKGDPGRRKLDVPRLNQVAAEAWKNRVKGPSPE